MQQVIRPKEDTRERVTIVHRKDLDISYFAGPGKGGQAKNKVHSGVQIKHKFSGAIGRASDSRSLEDNKQAAFQRLLKDPRMKFFIAQAIYEVNHRESLQETVEKELSSGAVRFEVKKDGKWTEVDAAHFDTAEAKAESD